MWGEELIEGEMSKKNIPFLYYMPLHLQFLWNGINPYTFVYYTDLILVTQTGLVAQKEGLRAIERCNQVDCLEEQPPAERVPLCSENPFLLPMMTPPSNDQVAGFQQGLAISNCHLRDSLGSKAKCNWTFSMIPKSIGINLLLIYHWKVVIEQSSKRKLVSDYFWRKLFNLNCFDLKIL